MLMAWKKRSVVGGIRGSLGSDLTGVDSGSSTPAAKAVVAGSEVLGWV